MAVYTYTMYECSYCMPSSPLECVIPWMHLPPTNTHTRTHPSYLHTPHIQHIDACNATRSDHVLPWAIREWQGGIHEQVWRFSLSRVGLGKTLHSKENSETVVLGWHSKFIVLSFSLRYTFFNGICECKTNAALCIMIIFFFSFFLVSLSCSIHCHTHYIIFLL